MAGRRTNLALMVLLVVVLATGALAYAVGTGWDAWVAVAHAVAGFAIVLLSPWKSAIARRGLSRRRMGRGLSVTFSVLIVTALLFGVFHSTGVLRALGPLTAMQIHVGAALLAIPLAVWHVRARPVRVHRTDVSRRQTLRTAALLGGAGVAYIAVEGLTRLASLPGARRRFTGSYETGSFRPDEMPVTQWLNDSVPEIDPSSWELRVHSGGRSVVLGYEDLEGRTGPVRATIDCTGGWYATQDWDAVRLDRLFEASITDPLDRFRSISVTSATGYGRRFPAHDASKLWLALRAGGEPLSPGHGFPARIVAPGRRGFWWVKWVERIELSDVPWWRQWPFPPT